MMMKRLGQFLIKVCVAFLFGLMGEWLSECWTSSEWYQGYWFGAVAMVGYDAATRFFEFYNKQQLCEDTD